MVEHRYTQRTGIEITDHTSPDQYSRIKNTTQREFERLLSNQNSTQEFGSLEEIKQLVISQIFQGVIVSDVDINTFNSDPELCRAAHSTIINNEKKHVWIDYMIDRNTKEKKFVRIYNSEHLPN